jgi:hypothetical protein
VVDYGLEVGGAKNYTDKERPTLLNHPERQSVLSALSLHEVTDREGSMHAKVISGTAGIGALAMALYAVSPRVTEREAALKIVRGELANSHVEPGVKMDAVLPQVEYIRLPKWLQRMTVDASEKDQVAVRTKEKAQVFGHFEIHYLLDSDHKDFGEIYTKLKCDEVTDLEPFIRNFALPAIIDTYREVPTSAVNDNLTDLGKKIAVKLQQTLESNNLPYIRVEAVIPSGVGLSQKANADLEQIVSEERKLDLQRVQAQVASNAVHVTDAQTAVTIRALQKLREAGVPDSQLATMYYIQLLRDQDGIGKPGVSGPIPGATPSFMVQSEHK